MDRASPFGSWLKQRRRSLDLTQDDLAIRVGCSWETIRKIEEGTRKPSKQMAELLAVHLRVPPEESEAFVQFARSEGGTNQPAGPSLAVLREAASPSDRPVAALVRLPSPPTPFVGHGPEVAAIAALLARPSVRLLTLTGSPGIGKTRHSIKAAGSVVELFPDGVVFVPLSPVSDPALVISVIAQTLGIREVPGQSYLDLLKIYLGGRVFLLILDNMEQVISAGVEIASLLEECPGLKVLVTSREPLHIYGEHQFAVPALSLPEQDVDPNPDTLGQYEAIQLFVERAQSTNPAFQITPQNASSIAGICRQLDGLPLALELTAARCKVLTPAAILSRLSNLRLLAGGARDLPRRQQTLKAAIDWSYDLLSEQEKTVFRRLSVFVGASLEAIEEVCSLPGEAGWDVLGLAASLVDKSLLLRDEDAEGEPRFSMRWAIREYARDRMAELGEGTQLRKQHADYFLRLAESAEPWLMSGRRKPWVQRLGDEHSNLSAALEWALSDDVSSEVSLRLAAALHWFWYFKGYLNEGIDWLERSLAGAGAGRRAAAGAKALDAAGRLCSLQGDFERARSRLEESIAAWRGLGENAQVAYPLANLGIVRVFTEGSPEGRLMLEEAVSLLRVASDKWGLAFCLDLLAEAQVLLGDTENSIPLYEESLALYRELSDPWGIASELSELSRAEIRAGNYEQAQARLEEALQIERKEGDPWNTGHSLRSLGDLAHCRGDYERAARFYAESAALFQQLGDRQRRAASLRGLGHGALRQHDKERATHLYLQSLEIAQELEGTQGLSRCMSALAGLALERGDPRMAARLLGAADLLAASSPGLMSPADQLEHARNSAGARQGLGDTDFESEWKTGRQIPEGQIVGYVLDWVHRGRPTRD